MSPTRKKDKTMANQGVENGDGVCNKKQLMPNRGIVDGGAWRLRVVHIPDQLPTLPVAPEHFQSAFGVEISSYLCICFDYLLSWTYLEKNCRQDLEVFICRALLEATKIR